MKENASINLFELLRIARRLDLSLRVLAVLIFLDLLSICFEVIGIGMLLPIFELLRAGHSVSVDQLRGQHWEIMRSFFGLFGLQVSLGLLFAISFANILLRQVLNYVSTYYNGFVRRRTGDKLRQRIFYQYLLAGTARQDETSLGEIVSVLKMDLSRGLDVLFTTTRSVGTIVHILVYLGGLFVLSWPMTAISLAVIAISVVLSRGYFGQIKQKGAAMIVSNRELTAFLVERLRHARLIRLSGTEKAESRAVYRLSRQYSSETLEQNLISTRLTLVPEPIAIGFTYLVLFVGTNFFDFSLEKLGLFVVILIRLMPIVRANIARYATSLGKVPSLERLNSYLMEISQAREAKGGDRSFAQLDRAITYDDVSFTYATSNMPALRDVSVTIPAHRMSALIGPSGAGKSTFVDLLPLLRRPTSGAIRFDGVPISEFSVASIRAGIAFVPQMPQIFNITIAEHIRYGKDDATDEEVREAARLAGALVFIESLPHGFDTLLGDDGLRLSGGQRQRLDIARALVRRAPILILDEPTSALDADAEAAFRDALQTLRVETNLTIIVIAHRLSTVVDADHIIVLNRGRVMATGSHTELMKAGGWYADALRKQQLGTLDMELSTDKFLVGAEQENEQASYEPTIAQKN